MLVKLGEVEKFLSETIGLAFGLIKESLEFLVFRIGGFKLPVQEGNAIVKLLVIVMANVGALLTSEYDRWTA